MKIFHLGLQDGSLECFFESILGQKTTPKLRKLVHYSENLSPIPKICPLFRKQKVVPKYFGTSFGTSFEEIQNRDKSIGSYLYIWTTVTQIIATKIRNCLGYLHRDLQKRGPGTSRRNGNTKQHQRMRYQRGIKFL